MVVIAEACPPPDTGRGVGVSEANGVLRNQYHPPGATIYRKETD